MALWDNDLTTEDGALGAAQMGGFACFVSAGLSVLGMAFTYGALRVGAIMPALWLAAGLITLVYLVAGFRMRAGKGLILGIVAALLVVLDLAAKLLVVSIVGIIIDAVVLIALINGIRGVLALRRGGFEAEDAAEIFS